MADTSNLSNFLGDVAEAIRTKREITDKIPAEQFDSEILKIETGIDTSDATATADNLEIDKTAYVNNTKIIGTLGKLMTINRTARGIAAENENLNMTALIRNPDTAYFPAVGQLDSNAYQMIFSIDGAYYMITSNKQCNYQDYSSYEVLWNGGNLTAYQLINGTWMQNRIPNITFERSNSVVRIDNVRFLSIVVGSNYNIMYTNNLSSVFYPQTTDLQPKNSIITPDTMLSISATNLDVANTIGLTADKLVKGNTVLGVEGTAETGGSGDMPVKLFRTQEEMNADTSSEDEALGLVYSKQMSNLTTGMQTQVITFPATVVLPEAITTSYDISMNTVDYGGWMDCWGTLSATGFSFSVYGEMSGFSINYSSTDGMTYTRTDDYGETMTLDAVVTPSTSYWNDYAGYFMQVEAVYFGGLFSYDKSAGVWEFAKTQLTLEEASQLLPGKIAYGKNGVITGDDSYYSIIDTYDLMKRQNSQESVRFPYPLSAVVSFDKTQPTNGYIYSDTINYETGLVTFKRCNPLSDLTIPDGMTTKVLLGCTENYVLFGFNNKTYASYTNVTQLKVYKWTDGIDSELTEVLDIPSFAITDYTNIRQIGLFECKAQPVVVINYNYKSLPTTNGNIIRVYTADGTHHDYTMITAYRTYQIVANDNGVYVCHPGYDEEKNSYNWNTHFIYHINLTTFVGSQIYSATVTGSGGSESVMATINDRLLAVYFQDGGAVTQRLVIVDTVDNSYASNSISVRVPKILYGYDKEELYTGYYDGKLYRINTDKSLTLLDSLTNTTTLGTYMLSDTNHTYISASITGAMRHTTSGYGSNVIENPSGNFSGQYVLPMKNNLHSTINYNSTDIYLTTVDFKFEPYNSGNLITLAGNSKIYPNWKLDIDTLRRKDAYMTYSGTISPTEYNTAVDTANEISGNEEE